MFHVSRTETVIPVGKRDRTTTTIVREKVQTSAEALAILMNEVSDLLDSGFKFDAPDGIFPCTTSHARKGNRTVVLVVRPI